MCGPFIPAAIGRVMNSSHCDRQILPPQEGLLQALAVGELAVVDHFLAERHGEIARFSRMSEVVQRILQMVLFEEVVEDEQGLLEDSDSESESRGLGSDKGEDFDYDGNLDS